MPSRSLVIVESPAKARTIGGFLGKDYVVESSIGHIRDLPSNAGAIPAAFKKAPWARLGVDVEHDFKPLYVIDADKKEHIAKLKRLLAESGQLFLATDEDREGESIAWHLLEVLKPKVPVKRMVFHEITDRAIQHAIQNPRDIDRRLVDAQEARRILDRLYGYEVSPVLWKKVMPRLSAGRVQSVATRIVVERETLRMRFRAASYWGIDVQLLTRAAPPAEIPATLASVDGQRIATGKDFGEDGTLARSGAVVLDQGRAAAVAEGLKRADVRVREIEKKPTRRSPSPPFMTSTLQQEAARKLRFSSKRAMQVAQRLYESGYITYMRTDSTTLSDTAITAARAEIERLYGSEYLPGKPRSYATKVKNAQEAHEAIRPAGDRFKMPEQVAGELGGDEARLYELIWMRTVASQMPDSRGESVTYRILARAEGAAFREAELTASGNVILFPGFLRAYVEGSDDPGAELEGRERHLPAVKEGEALDVAGATPGAHETQPPARFTEASLIRQLEELGVGRPSTYASIISTIQDRGYVWKKGTALVPSFTAFAVVKLLIEHFGNLVDYAFTARMEDDLDAIARGAQQSLPWLQRFYFGRPPEDGAPAEVGLHALVESRLGDIDARAINSLPIGADAQGRELVVRVGRFGAYLQRGETTASLPDNLVPDELTIERASALLDAPSGDRTLGSDPTTKLPVLLKSGRYGAYVQLGEYDKDAKEKPKTASLLKSTKLEDATLEDALRVLALPREIGTDPSSGVTITAQIGRYGPYVARGTESRNLESEVLVFSVDLPAALKLFLEAPKRRARAAAGPLKELGLDPVSGKAITLREGRFGPYVSDGETHASLRRDDSPAEITHERAVELLAERRARGPGKPARGRGTRRAAGRGAAKTKPGARKPAAAKAAPRSKKPAAARPAKGTKVQKADLPPSHPKAKRPSGPGKKPSPAPVVRAP